MTNAFRRPTSTLVNLKRRESHEEYLKRTALREAQKAVDRRGGKALTEDELRKLRIQTVEPWDRIFLLVVGLLVCGAGAFVVGEDKGWLGGLMLVFGILVVGAGLFGWKRTVDAALNGLDLITLFDGFF